MFGHVVFAAENASMWFILVNLVCCKMESASCEKQSSLTLTDTWFSIYSSGLYRY